jgi:hypothetical protein
MPSCHEDKGLVSHGSSKFSSAFIENLDSFDFVDEPLEIE